MKPTNICNILWNKVDSKMDNAVTIAAHNVSHDNVHIEAFHLQTSISSHHDNKPKMSEVSTSNFKLRISFPSEFAFSLNKKHSLEAKTE